MRIVVVGRADRNVAFIESAVQTALGALGVEGSVEVRPDAEDLCAHWRALTPALVVDGEILLEGRVPFREEVRELLAAHAVDEPVIQPS